MNNKLMFIQFRKFGETLNQFDYDHNSDERALTRAWKMDKAVNEGYVVLDMYKLWEYKMPTYENGRFTDFINKFLNTKQEASGYLSCGKTEEDKGKYIADYFSLEKVQWEKGKICKNGGWKLLEKLMLNFLLGKVWSKENVTKKKQ